MIAPDVIELEQGSPKQVAAENAARKARRVARHAGDVPVLGVDTVVSLDSRIYGKPADAREARRTLRDLSGRSHAVTSGICLVHGSDTRAAIAVTAVRFRELDEELLDWYVGAGEWRDRAGGYAIQGRGAALVEAIDGDYLNVVGLPVAALLELAPWLLGSAR